MTTGRRALSEPRSRKGECEVCGQRVSLLNLTGMLRRHPRTGQMCPGSYTAPAREREVVSR